MARGKPVSAEKDAPIRVMVVDDSAVIHSFLTRFIEEDKNLKVSVTAGNGEVALSLLARQQVDVLVLDIEMPVMDGLTALPLILKVDPDLQVIIASTLTKENAVITMKCLQAGAAECLAKPQSQDMTSSDAFKRNLVEKVRTLGRLTRHRRRTSGRDMMALKGEAAGNIVPRAEKKFSLRTETVKLAPDVIAVGSSTGGPQALMQFFSDLKKPLRQPVLVTQHMPATFTAILADHIAKQSGLVCREAVDGEMIRGGGIYIAPGNYHMTVVQEGLQKKISLNQEPPENFCRPAVDPMLRSLVSAYGKKILAVILTGMGADGKKGCEAVIDAGGMVLAQDETTSVVWGMPGAVAMAGLCTKVMPLGLMAQEVRGYADKTGGVS